MMYTDAIQAANSLVSIVPSWGAMPLARTMKTR
ncbi:Uncharacterised protein [Escherichia coli]|nr:Uncharacterised protein [Escherichia coli]